MFMGNWIGNPMWDICTCLLVLKLSNGWKLLIITKWTRWHFDNVPIGNEVHKSILKFFIYKKFKKQFYFLPVFYLVMCLKKAPKNFGKIAILKIWELVSLGGAKTHFGKIALK